MQRKVSSKIVVLASFAIIIFVFGLLLGNLLVFASVPIVMYLAFAFLQSEELHADVKIVRTLEKSQLSEEETTQVRLRITNLGKKKIPVLAVSDSVPEDVRDQDATSSSFSLKLNVGETKDLFYVLKAKSFGIYTLGPVSLKCEDSFGINTLETVVECASTMVVLPKATQKLTHFKIGPRRTKPWPGEIVARKIGLGMDNYSIRQFVPGDSFRRINWKASARANEDQLLLNEQRSELGADTMIIVDARPVSNLGLKEDSTVVHSVHAAISISDKLLKDRNRVGLITVGQFSDRIPPGYGRRQYNRLILSLIKVRPGEFVTFENIARYLKFFYANLAQIILISPLTDDESFSAAADIARLGYELIVVSPNPIDFSSAKSSMFARNSRTNKISADLAQLVRKTNMIQLRKVHAVVVDWRKNEPLDHALVKNVRAWNRQTALARNH
ncbi:MAG: DUF58 domain-containing protein [Nitrososphaerales archaeon]